MDLERLLIGPGAEDRELIGAVDTLQHFKAEIATVLARRIAVGTQRGGANLGEDRTNLNLGHGEKRGTLRKRGGWAEQGHGKTGESK
jgi:hypothetical protein